MEYTNLGRTGLQVSRLCLGTMNFGPETSEEDSGQIMDRAVRDNERFMHMVQLHRFTTDQKKKILAEA